MNESRILLDLPENRKKSAKLLIRRDDRRISFRIEDPGPGFEWKNYLRGMKPSRFRNRHRKFIVFCVICEIGGVNLSRMEAVYEAV